MTLIDNYNCPQRPVGRDRNSKGQFLTSYVVPTGPQTIFEGIGPGSALLSMTDGTSNTLMAMEACGTSIVWTEPRDRTSRSTPSPLMPLQNGLTTPTASCRPTIRAEPRCCWLTVPLASFQSIPTQPCCRRC